jgi:hypothetical protein
MDTVCAVIGDVVGSRLLPDRAAAQSRLQAELIATNAAVHAVQPLEATVGDEFQGAYASVAEAVLAALQVRLGLLPEIDVRVGIGVGEVDVIDADRRPMLQDGPGWWAARDALDDLARPRRGGDRTAYVGPGQAEVNAFLLVRDSLVERLGERGVRLLAGALRGRTQAELASAEGISRPAVSRQFARGVGAVQQAHAQLASTTAWGWSQEVR